MERRAVIFDFGGVIFKTRDYSPRHKWDHQLGLPIGTVERTVHNETSWRAVQRGEISLSTYWADVAKNLGVSEDKTATSLAADFYSGDEMDTDIIALIKRLRADGHTVALLSNDTADLLRPRLKMLGIEELFVPLVISSDIGVMKPDAAAYEVVLAQLGRPGGETIFIDDRPENITGAEVLGIHGIHYVDGMDLSAALDALLFINT